MDNSIKVGSESYSESQKKAYYYLDKQAADPSWRPCCPDCRTKPIMLKLTDGFVCLNCKTVYNRVMIKQP